MGGDDFFKKFFIVIFGFIFFVGLIMFLQMEEKVQDEREVSRYIKTRGKTNIPSSWKSKMGEGI